MGGEREPISLQSILLLKHHSSLQHVFYQIPSQQAEWLLP